MDPVAVEQALRARSIAPSAAEAAAVAQDLARLKSAMGDITHAWSGLPGTPGLTGLLARPAAGIRLDADGEEPDIETPAMPDAAHLRRCQAATNAFIEIFALGPATSRGRDGIGALGGLSFAHKDVFVADARFPTCGVGRGYAWRGPQSSILSTLRREWASAVGATNLDPHCYTALGLNRDFGRVLNPHGAAFAVGGSSSGSAAAVAAGAAAFALGTDTGGSVRIPAALCGVYGLLPTHGVLADPGMAPLSRSHDSPGILAADMTILRRVFRVLSGRSRPGRSLLPAGSTPRVGIDLGNFCNGSDEDVDICRRNLVKRLGNLGIEVVDVDMPPVDHLNTLASVITGFEAAALHRHGLATHPEHYPASVRRRLLTALLVERALYDQAAALRPLLLQAVLDRVFSRADILLCPTIRKVAARVDAIDEDDEAGIGRLSFEHLRLNRPLNYLGLPALSIPAGRDANGIPIGMQLIAPPNAEENLFGLASALARA